ncbi:hypothetical protein VNO78_31035 [Psophocarpus tetragonolobus]|uniref:Uncharacterized protein n=1 Tax=Psophocarpus tetragonolobus TaxID=3891 RepID=A0AAN9X8N2_PSOTE
MGFLKCGKQVSHTAKPCAASLPPRAREARSGTSGLALLEAACGSPWLCESLSSEGLLLVLLLALCAGNGTHTAWAFSILSREPIFFFYSTLAAAILLYHTILYENETDKERNLTSVEYANRQT